MAASKSSALAPCDASGQRPFPVSDLAQELGLEEKTAAVDLAIDTVVATNQTDAFYLRANLEHGGGAFDLQVLDQNHRIAIGQDVAVGVLHDIALLRIVRAGLFGAPFMTAVRANNPIPIGVGICLKTQGAGWERAHESFAGCYRRCLEYQTKKPQVRGKAGAAAALAPFSGNLASLQNLSMRRRYQRRAPMRPPQLSAHDPGPPGCPQEPQGPGVAAAAAAAVENVESFFLSSVEWHCGQSGEAPARTSVSNSCPHLPHAYS